MATCKAGPGTCTVSCPSGCGCAYVWSEKRCICSCFGVVGGGQNQFTMGTMVTVHFSGLPLSEVATKLDRMLVREVHVPATRMNEKVSFRMDRVSFSAVLKKLGLTSRPRAGKAGLRKAMK
jgi:hypothetical protein